LIRGTGINWKFRLDMVLELNNAPQTIVLDGITNSYCKCFFLMNFIFCSF